MSRMDATSTLVFGVSLARGVLPSSAAASSLVIPARMARPAAPACMHAGAAGRAILAGMTRDEAAALLGSTPLAKLTPNTNVDVASILDIAATDAHRGYTVSRSE